MNTTSTPILVSHYGLEVSAKKYTDKVAIVMEGKGEIGFAELDRRANQVANALLASGLRKGDKVAIMLMNCLEYPEIIYGCSKAGIVFVPLSYLSAGPEVEFLVTHSDSRMLITSSQFFETIREVRQKMPNLELTVMMGGDQSEEIDYHQWRSRASGDKPDVPVTEWDDLYIGYTSGTTGDPKGAVVSQRARALQGFAASIEYGFGPDTIHITSGAIYHGGPMGFMLMQSYFGATTVILERFDPIKVLGAIDRYKVNHGFFAPTMLHVITSLPEDIRRKYDVSSMKAIISAGAPLPTKVKEDVINYFSRAGLHEFYGSTEAALCTSLRPNDQLRKIRSCGKPLIGWEVKLLDEHYHEITESEKIGEIFVRGEYLFNGYYKNPEATRQAHHNGWFSAGDLGKMDDEGYLYIVDRKKDMVLSGGVNIYPVEVEDCLLHHPDVADVAVIGVPHEKWGEAVKAVVVLKQGCNTSEDGIISFCEGKIARYKKPKSVSFVDSIPTSPSGKKLKRELRKMFSRQ